jgi:hypothetical protein
VTALSRRSRGARHSYLVKRGIHRLPEPIINPDEFEKAAASAHRANVWRGMVALLNKLALPIPTPDEIEVQLKAGFQRGYIQALRDVKLERLRQERASYAEAMQPVSHQEYRTMTNRFSK